MYTHCYAHALNIAIGETIKRSKVCCDALNVSFEISKLIKFSPKRNALFHQIKVANADEVESSANIQTFSNQVDSMGKSVARILENFHNLKQFWGMSAWKKIEARSERADHWCKSADMQV